MVGISSEIFIEKYLSFTSETCADYYTCDMFLDKERIREELENLSEPRKISGKTLPNYSIKVMSSRKG